jgi:hypothetical protein
MRAARPAPRGGGASGAGEAAAAAPGARRPQRGRRARARGAAAAGSAHGAASASIAEERGASEACDDVCVVLPLQARIAAPCMPAQLKACQLAVLLMS